MPRINRSCFRWIEIGKCITIYGNETDNAKSRADTSTAAVEFAKKQLKEAGEEEPLGGTNHKKRKRTDSLDDDDDEEGNKKPAAAVAQNTPASTNVDINNNNNVDDEVEGCTKTLFQAGDFLYMNPWFRDD